MLKSSFSHPYVNQSKAMKGPQKMEVKSLRQTKRQSPYVDA